MKKKYEIIHDPEAWRGAQEKSQYHRNLWQKAAIKLLSYTRSSAFVAFETKIIKFRAATTSIFIFNI